MKTVAASVILFLITVIRNSHGNHPVLLVVLDGFRHDYVQSANYETPNLQRILSGGVLLPQLEPEFPASRHPFLVSLLTGRHSGSHGIFAEHIFSETDEQVQSIDEESSLWTDAKTMTSLWVGFDF